MVYEGDSLTLYVDGKPEGQLPTKSSMKRKVNGLPFIVGADPDARGRVNSFFNGEIDEIRISKGARYEKPFEPKRRLTSDKNTIIFLDCDQSLGPFLIDRSPQGHYFRLTGDAHITDVKESVEQE